MKRFVAVVALVAALTPLGIGRASAALPGKVEPKRADHITCVVVDQLDRTVCLDRLPLPRWPLW